MCACVNVTCNYRPISASLKLGPSSKHRHSETHTAVKWHTYSGVWRVHVCLHVSDSLGFAQLSGVGFHLSTLRQNYEVYWHETVKEKNTSHYLIIIVISSKIVQSHPEASRSAIQSKGRRKSNWSLQIQNSRKSQRLGENPPWWRNLEQTLLWDCPIALYPIVTI